MRMGVIASQAASQFGPTPPLTGVFGSADFKNGVYEIGGDPATFNDFIMTSDDWGTVDEGDITPGVGLVGTKFPAVAAMLANSYIAVGVTAVFEFVTDASQPACSFEFLDTPDFDREFEVTVGNNSIPSVISQPSGNTTLSGNVVAAGSHKAAITFLIDGRISLSVDGGTAESTAWNGDGSAINTVGIYVHFNTTLTKISFLSVQADVDLPALST